MHYDVASTIPCPSCGAPLNGAGRCAHCGSQARGFWQDLDLGTPELAAAVIEGLDYYLVLDAAPADNHATLSDAYRRRRALYPHDPRQLHPQLARQLGLLEEAWRILGQPTRRARYDQLRTARADRPGPAQPALRSVSCGTCGAALGQAASFCPACGAAQTLPTASVPEQSIEHLPAYYDVLGVSPRMVRSSAAQWHARSRVGAGALFDLLTGDDDLVGSAPMRLEAPDDDELRLAYVTRQQELLLRNDPQADLNLEVAYRVLSDPRRRSTYDTMMRELRERGWTEQRMRALSALDREVRAELSGGSGSTDGAGLLQQGKGLLKLNLPQQAVPVLQRAAQALPDSAEAHYSYGMAIWRSTDLMSFTGHQLRQGIAALQRAAQLDPRLDAVVAPYLGVWQGLLAYNDGELAAAVAQFRTTATRYPTFAAAWRMCATAALRQQQPEVALEACQRALALEPNAEPVLLLAIGACWRQRRTDEAVDLAARVARLRGSSSAASVLRELGLR